MFPSICSSNTLENRPEFCSWRVFAAKKAFALAAGSDFQKPAASPDPHGRTFHCALSLSPSIL